ncbi:MAG: hypothetical protein EU517_01075 [Promethearchaeota archaeon]|nr:MAG: hypothetical protein EU517_01075 [Candidatus Lokiarchaeota archaeon]
MMSNEELEFLAAIYEGFLQTKNDQNRKFMWKLNAISRTMNFSNDQTDDGFCENALRMIVNLFHHYVIYESEIEEIPTRETMFNEKEIILPILMEEFV